MFGYVRPHVGELRVREADSYRAFYCGVCRQLGQQCGPACRLFLQYDFAFLAIVMDIVFVNEVAIEKKRCAVNPFKQLSAADGAAVRYAADAHGILMLGKAMDDVDDGAFARRAPLAVFRRTTIGAAGRRAGLYAAMVAMLKRQAEAERDNAAIDDASEPFSTFCAEMFSPGEAPGNFREALRWMGLHLGKWIYMADALDDFDIDQKKNAFNPLRAFASRDDAADHALPLMNLCAEQAVLALDVLPERRYYAIVRNILEQGLYETAKRIADNDIGSRKSKKGRL